MIDNIKDMDPNTRIDKFKYFMTILTETLKRGEEKVALAKSTCEIVIKKKRIQIKEISTNKLW